MLLLGCKPPGRNTEQHDIFFGIGDDLASLREHIIAFWKEAGKIHIDAWREVTLVDRCSVTVVPKLETVEGERLFFINLGGYKKDEFEEYHYKMLVAATDKGTAVSKAKQSAFFRHTGFAGATSHIDDRYGVDVDDAFEISDILPAAFKQHFSILLTPSESREEDVVHLGYLKLDKLVQGTGS